MLKRSLLILTAIAALTSHTISAKDIEVESRGIAPVIGEDFQLAKFNATRDALRNASENTNMELFSFTNYQDASISNDLIISRSNAFVRSFDVVSVAEIDGKVRVDLLVKLTDEEVSRCLGEYNYRFAIANPTSEIALSVNHSKKVEDLSVQLAKNISTLTPTQYNKNFVKPFDIKPLQRTAKRALEKSGYQYLIIPSVTGKHDNGHLNVKFDAYDIIANDYTDSFETNTADEIEESFMNDELKSTFQSRTNDWLKTLSSLPCKTPQGVLITREHGKGSYEISLGREHNLTAGDKVAFFDEPQSIAKFQMAIATGTVKSVFKNKAFVTVSTKHEKLSKTTIAAPLSPSFFNL